MAITQKSFADYVKDLMAVLPTVNDNPMMSVTSMTDADKYRENPFYMQEAIRKRIAEEEAAKKAGQSGSGLFASTPSDGGGDGSGGRNYYVEREAQLRAANLPEDEVQSILRAEQEANNARLASGLNLFANAFIPGMGLFNTAKYGQALPDYLQGNARVMMGDTSGYNNGFLGKAAGIAAPVVSGMGGTTRSSDAIQEAIARAQAMANPAPVVNLSTRSDAAIQESIDRAQAASEGYTGNTDVSKSDFGGYGSEVGYG